MQDSISSPQIIDIDDGQTSLADVEGLTLQIRRYTTNVGQYGPAITIEALIEQTGEAVEVVTSAAVVTEQVATFFAQHPEKIMRAVPRLRDSSGGRQYWKLTKPRGSGENTVATDDLPF